MIRANIIVQLEDGENIYKVNDRVRIKMKSDNPERAREYIGFIDDINDKFVTMDCGIAMRQLKIIEIDRIRFARNGETFDNTWNFDD